jgi:hypothetical protein
MLNITKRYLLSVLTVPTNGIFVLMQKIAAFGSAYRKTHSNVGAAEGCDLLILLLVLVQLAHQLGLSLGQPAGLSQFIDAGAHPHQFRRLGE